MQPAAAALANDQEALPSLGDQASATVSPAQEQRIGQAFLRMVHAQAPTRHDPLLTDYLEHLLFLLASNSDLNQPGQLSLVVIDSSDINAFAAPGGIIGLNAGLLLHASTEDELAAVIAHELAHLSQRHFARGVEQGQRMAWTNLAAILASIAIAATAGGEAGMAAFATTQAASLEQQLRFSRLNEQEADRLGMQTLARADMNPEAMPGFFERMLHNMRYAGTQPPEFLLTHPITQSRITDSRHRAAAYPPRTSQASLEFLLMQARLRVAYARDLTALIKELNHQLSERKTPSPEATRYALAYAYLRANQPDKALAQLEPLMAERPNRITYVVTKGAILREKGNLAAAHTLLENELKLAPGNYALSLGLAETLLRQQQGEAALAVMQSLLPHHGHRPIVWQGLSEIQGHLKHHLSAHEAQAEFLFLMGRLDRAMEQLGYALNLAGNDFVAQQRLKKRLQQMAQSRNDLNL